MAIDAATVVAATVTPTVVAGYALYQQRQEHEHEKEAELRVVLDAAAEKANRARRAMENFATRYAEQSAKEAEEIYDEAMRNTHEQARATVEATRLARDQLAIRLGGRSPVLSAYTEFLRSITALQTFLRQGTRSGRQYDLDAFEELHNDVKERQRGYIEAAHRRVGIRLSARSRLTERFRGRDRAVLDEEPPQTEPSSES
jgi:hypothetical protein